MGKGETGTAQKTSIKDKQTRAAAMCRKSIAEARTKMADTH